jgi:D-tyrosyl-tRNA(Tyr) deacylase
MRVVIQRVAKASVKIAGEVVGQIGRGLVVLVGICDGDDAKAIAFLVDKTVNLRIFPDDDDKMNRSVLDIGGGVLIVSQFTLYGDCRKGRRPSFVGAAGPEVAIPLYEAFVERMRSTGIPVQTGRFGAMMDVELINEGPVTLIIDSPEK